MEESSRDGGEFKKFKGWRRGQGMKGWRRGQGMEERSRDGVEVKGWRRGQRMEERSRMVGRWEDGLTGTQRWDKYSFSHLAVYHDLTRLSGS
jgi:hypothetical protein